MKNNQFTVGDWHVHAGTNTIERNGRSIHLPPRIVDLLSFLAENVGEVVSRDMLVNSVWKNCETISDQAITQCVSELRKFLRDNRPVADTPTYIQTVPKRGYRLVCPVTTEPLAAEHAPVVSANEAVADETGSSDTHDCTPHRFSAVVCTAPDSAVHDAPLPAAPRKVKKTQQFFGWARCLWLNKVGLGFRQCY